METTDVNEVSSDKLAAIDHKLEVLAYPEHLKPLEFSGTELQVMRDMLERGGCKLELEVEDEDRLMHPQFRRLDQGKGQAIIAILGETRATRLIDLCRDLREEGPRIISLKTGEPIEGSEGRGERQGASELLALGVFASDSVKVKQILGRLNTRIWKGAKKDADKEIRDRIDKVFTDAATEAPQKTVASMLPENLHPIWLLLNGREPEEE